MVPISYQIESAPDLLEIYRLFLKIEDLLYNLLCQSKREIPGRLEKNKHKARLSLYCDLYRKVRKKLVKMHSGLEDVNYKAPPTLEDFLKRVAYKKQPITFKHHIFKMERQLFNRHNAEVINNAISLTVVDFINHYKDITQKDVLEKAYHQIRSANSKLTPSEKINKRVGEDVKDEPLSPLSPVTADEVVETKEELKHFQEKSTELIKKEELIAKPGDVTIENIPNTNLKEVKVEKIPNAKVQQEPKEGEVDFKALKKKERDELVKQYSESINTVVNTEIRNKLKEDGFINVTYDHVYYGLEFLKKQKA